MIGFFHPTKYDLLMSVQHLQEALAKMAAGELETNDIVRGENAITPSTDKSKAEQKAEHSVAVEREAAEERPEMLKRLFKTLPSASSEDKKLVNGMTDEAWRNYQSHSVLLQKNAEHAPKTASLSSRVRSVLGRR